ncbi:basal-body rod modification protein FlgD [Marinobacterium nitratireducens]|uniref:Basal-body rod modification protein FlgD n=1 Tax=Marinobacterium nitratireducens TaxID=518897 RepID=A0A917ZJT2_9GAMM|nr:flagellar hook capping FlgD N-terminal domain-containing protein [Marinobacterium nitratireducens]GGO84900.1 basal-body rod modification protein FlgD [Marinobacterium nitratireducens]
MSNVNNVNGSNVFDQINQANQANGSSKSKAESDSEMFMKLMIAQLQNQDPTSPADTTDFMQQIATMSNVESIANLTTAVESMGESLLSSQAALQASSMVGQKAFVQTDLANLPEDGQVDGLVSLENAASDVWLSVYDRNGVLVDRQQLGAQVAGDHSFVWRGNDEAPAGQYKVVAQAQVGDNLETLPVYIGHRINSVTLGQNGIGMQVNTDVGSTSVDNIKQLG